MNQVSDDELIKVIKDFLEMGHIDNIIAMFHREPDYFKWTGKILDDERFNVRLGVSILFEELKNRKPDRTDLAIASLLPLLNSDLPNIRGEAVSVLGIIGGRNVHRPVAAMTEDPNPQVRELAEEIMAELNAADRINKLGQLSKP